MRKQASTYSSRSSRTGMPAAQVWLRVLGLISPVILPLIGVWVQQQFSIFQASEIDIVIPVGFFLAGVVTGVLLRAWWSVTYIFILGFVLTILKLALTDEYPGSDSDVITLAFAIILVPLLMIGTAVGMVMGKLVERG